MLDACNGIDGRCDLDECKVEKAFPRFAPTRATNATAIALRIGLLAYSLLGGDVVGIV